MHDLTLEITGFLKATSVLHQQGTDEVTSQNGLLHMHIYREAIEAAPVFRPQVLRTDDSDLLQHALHRESP